MISNTSVLEYEYRSENKQRSRRKKNGNGLRQLNGKKGQKDSSILGPLEHSSSDLWHL